MLNVVPDIHSSPRQPARPPQQAATPLLRQAGIGASITVMLNVVSLVLAVGMIVILFFLSQSVRKVASLEDRLADLTRFEKRLSGQIETVNQGFHGQFDELNGRLSALMNEAAEINIRLEKLAAARGDLDPEPDSFEELESAVAEPEPEAFEETSEAIPQAPEAQSNPPAKARSSPVQFERIEGPDGKVTYSKLR